MVPINEVLIAKIVLGYLSSRNLSGTADYFVKECEGFHSSNEPGMCEKERILNHLEGLNLLPSLEDILKDYFAYQGPDEVANDKVYMLWKQVDVVIGQLRAITMGKSKAKAFMNSRRAPRTFNKLVNRNENNQTDTNQFIGNETNRQATGLQNAQKAQGNQVEKIDTFMLQEGSSTKRTDTAVTPVKLTVRKDDKKEFKSPRRKPRHPRHVTTSTEELVKCSTSEVVSDAPLNREFSDLVAALISNDKLSVKLADNINKVVSVETKPPSKFDDIDEIIKLTADDPDLNVLFSMLGDPHPHSSHDATQPVNQHFDVNTAIASAGLSMESTKLNNYIELQPIVTSASNTQIEIVNSNLQPSFTCMESVDKLNIPQSGDANLQPFLMQDPSITNFLEILNPYSSSYPCMRDLNDDFSDYTNKMETSYEPLRLSEPLKSLQEGSSIPKSINKTTLDTSQIDSKLSLPNGSVITRPELQSISTCTTLPHGEVVKDDTNTGYIEKKNVDDNVILASHALLQLSTSPMKLSTTSTVENVISRPIVSPQALASNRKISRELICSTNYTIQENHVEIANDISSDIVTPSNQIINSQNIYILSDPNHSNKACGTSGTQPNSVASNAPGLKDGRKHTRKKSTKIKKSNVYITEDNIPIPPGEIEDTINKKPKRGKEIMVTQLDFNPAIPSTPLNRLNKVDDNGINNNNNNNKNNNASIELDISPKMDHCDISPAASLHSQLNTFNSKNHQTIGENNVESNCMRNSSPSYPELNPAVSEEEIYSKCSIVKPTSDHFQTFRIKGNAISKVVSSDDNNKDKPCKNISDATFSCKSKIRAISMVINNTNSLNKISDANTTNNLSIGATMSANKLQVNYDPLQLKFNSDNMNTSSLNSTDNSSYINIRKNCFMPSPRMKGTNNDYLGLEVSSDSTWREKGKDSVSSQGSSHVPKDLLTSKLNSHIPTDGRCDDSTPKLDTDCFGNILNKNDNVMNDITTNVVTDDVPQNESDDNIRPQLFTKMKNNGRQFQKQKTEKEQQTNSIPACDSSKISRKKEKSYPTRSKYKYAPSSKKMTVKFNFKKSPTRKKHFNPERENTIKREAVESTHICEARCDINEKEDSESHKDVDLVMSKIEPLSYPVTTTVYNQKTVCSQSFLQCLKKSCNIVVTSSNMHSNNKFVQRGERNSITHIDTTGTYTPDSTTIDFSIINTATNESRSMDVATTDLNPTPNIHQIDIPTGDITSSNIPLHITDVPTRDIIPTTDIPISEIPMSNLPTCDVSTSDVPNDMAHVPPNDISICENATMSTLQVPSSVSHPFQVMSDENNILNVGIQPMSKITKRKAKRKRNLSLLMNVENVAQLLSGIDYS